MGTFLSSKAKMKISSRTKSLIHTQTCLQGNEKDSLGEFSNMSYGMFGAEKVKMKSIFKLLFLLH